MNAIMLRVWQYMRELRLIDPEDRKAARDYYHNYRGYLLSGFIGAMAFSLFLTHNHSAQVISIILITAAGLLLAFT